MTNHMESFWNASPKVVNKVFVVEDFFFFNATLKSNQRRHIKQSELLSDDEP